mmetsp:Transcript_28279/g.43163  ORF Transcript_28279/g.43163 Transcript_28279/m.43163 type:complete len:629 (+) Transcript_28279:1090-2976(+)|eukprot:CAMPEP_0194237640 /NCGR_PEP_ID=MMETSP0158-20130606/4590_1 /TAXON_ID=33649 /ORGANISM="Thalassionema nitzschioides, Strain L26-B" /LENGTH=628 /DNA_ID=CAMNT_0038971715 /DNA_START=75 /DNA_END=1961 /DNA_ORIENTATION=-
MDSISNLFKLCLQAPVVERKKSVDADIGDSVKVGDDDIFRYYAQMKKVGSDDPDEITQVEYVKYGDRFYTLPLCVGINTRRKWDLVYSLAGAPLLPYAGDVDQNPHAIAKTQPEKFWITAKELIAFLSETILGEGRPDLDGWKIKATALYREACKDKYYPDFKPTSPPNQMNWYKFNRTYTENLTRDMGKGLSFCYSPSITDANSVEKIEDATTMISYAYNSDPSEMLEVLNELITKNIINANDKVFFCSFANFQVNKDDKFRKTNLGNTNAPTVGAQVDDNPFEKIARKVKKFIVVHTSGEDIYSRKWCCYELTRALKNLQESNGKNQIYMTGSKAYCKKVRDALKLQEGIFTEIPEAEDFFRRNYITSYAHSHASIFWKNALVGFKLEESTIERMMVLSPVDSERSNCTDVDTVEHPITNMLNAGIKQLFITLSNNEPAYDIQEGTRDEIMPEVVRNATIVQGLEGFRAVNHVINRVRQLYHAKVAIQEGVAVVEVSVPNSGKQDAIIIEGIHFEEGPPAAVSSTNPEPKKGMMALAFSGSLEQYDRQVPRDRASNEEVVAAINDVKEELVAAINGIRAVVNRLEDVVGVASTDAIEDDLDNSRDRIITIEDRNNNNSSEEGIVWV